MDWKMQKGKSLLKVNISFECSIIHVKASQNKQIGHSRFLFDIGKQIQRWNVWLSFSNKLFAFWKKFWWCWIMLWALTKNGLKKLDQKFMKVSRFSDSPNFPTKPYYRKRPYTICGNWGLLLHPPSIGSGIHYATFFMWNTLFDWKIALWHWPKV